MSDGLFPFLRVYNLLLLIALYLLFGSPKALFGIGEFDDNVTIGDLRTMNNIPSQLEVLAHRAALMKGQSWLEEELGWFC